MTERFKIGLDLITIEDTSKEYGALNQDEVVDLLNEQHETIERLNQQLRIFSDGLKAEIRETKEVFEDYSECVDEKKQLKKENEQLKHQLQQQELEYATTCHRLAEENESLKEENKFLRNKVATYKKGNALLKKSMDKEWK